MHAQIALCGGTTFCAKLGDLPFRCHFVGSYNLKYMNPLFMFTTSLVGKVHLDQ